jgi:hypothetical protein
MELRPTRGSTSEEDAAAVRAGARSAVLANAEVSAKREQERARRQGTSLGETRGRRAGAAAGKKAGETKIADAYASDVTGGDLTEKPSEIILGNHSQLEEITWSEWGADLAVGSGTLFRIVECDPSCAEDPGERLPATVKAWEPTFNPDNVRYYSKLTVEPSEGTPFTVTVNAY